MRVNAITGEVDDWEPDEERPETGILRTPRHGETEDDVAQAFPSLADVESALIGSRTRIGRSITYIRDRKKAADEAKRTLLKVRALARREEVAAGEHRTLKDVDAAVDLDERVESAREAADDAALALAYARLLKSALFEDVEILRSLNANMRNEIRR